jgi:hypothetical protein
MTVRVNNETQYVGSSSTILAELHEAAVRSHRTAAERYNQGERETADEHSAEAIYHAVKAYAASKHAREKSTHRTKHAS